MRTRTKLAAEQHDGKKFFYRVIGMCWHRWLEKIDRGLRLRAPTDRIRRDEDCVKELGAAD